MPSSLPFDVLQIILEEVGEKESLARCCSASKILLNIARPLLYREIELLVCKKEVEEDTDDEDTDGSSDAGGDHVIYEAHDNCYLLLRTLRRGRHLRGIVQTLIFGGTKKRAGRNLQESDGPGAIFRQFVDLLPTLKSITLIDPLHFNDIDSFLIGIQQNRPHSPEIRLVFLTGDYPTQPLRASYASFECENNTLRYKRPFAFILPNIRSFVLHCVTDMTYLSIPDLQNLEHLELLWIDPPSYRSAEVGISRLNINRFSESISRLANLRTLVVSGEPLTLTRTILSPNFLTNSIPPSVLTLSIKSVLPTDTLVILFQSLPLATGIKTLKIRSVEGDPTQLREECQKTGIRLALV